MPTRHPISFAMPAERRSRRAVLPVRSPLLVWFFSRVMARAMRRDFRAVRLLRPGVPPLPDDRPVIIYMNHPAWWDAAFMLMLTGSVFRGRASFAPMDAQQLARYRFMARIGAFGLERGAYTAAARFLHLGHAILQQPRALLWVTAEGAFTDVRRRPVHLRPGLAHLARMVPDTVLLPFAVEYPFWEGRGAEALGAFGPSFAAAEVAGQTPRAATAELARRLERTMDRLAHAAAARDAGAFETIVEGRSTDRGGYALWQRLHGRGALARRS
jgi:1-acyl-sn-glycerol-3-phosphate acyltransferase